MKQDRQSGYLFYLIAGTLLSLIISALFAAAAFLYMIPYLNMAAAGVLTPTFCILFQKLLLRKKAVQEGAVRFLTGLISLIGAYTFISVTMGVVAAMFGAEPLELDEMRSFELYEYVEQVKAILTNAALYITDPGRLMQDIIGRGEPLWGAVSIIAFITQIGLPQVFISSKQGNELPDPPKAVK